MNNTSTSSEKCLIEKCIQGDRKSQKELYEKFAAKMFAVCLDYSKNQVEAEYILQDGFVRLFNNLYRFDGNQPFENWVKRIFSKTAFNAIKHTEVQIVKNKNLENMAKCIDENNSDNFYHKVFVGSSEEYVRDAAPASRLYAVKGFLRDAVIERPAFNKEGIERKFREEDILAEEFFKNKAGKAKNVNFSYTVQKEDYKRLDKKGMLRVYNLSKPVDIPLVGILGKWKKQHIGVTLVAIDGKWCIKGGAASNRTVADTAEEPLSFQLFKKFGW